MLRRNFLSFLASVPFMGMLKADARKPVRYVKLVEILVSENANMAHLPMTKDDDCFDYLGVPLKGDMKVQSIDEFLLCPEVQRHLKTYRTVPVLYVFYKEYSGRKVAVNMCLTNQQHHLYDRFYIQHNNNIYNTYTSSTHYQYDRLDWSASAENLRIGAKIGSYDGHTILRTTDYEY